ncbi:MAG: DUF1801 domain-containing protein [Candidatus Helarchaeota archaeon]|nr:DUF1801 domain-containing protein [Candidatus Helarchaeota archaeon]
MVHEEVTKYIEKQKSPQREIAAKLREIILKTYPEINETFKNGAPWYEDMFYIGAFKNKVHLGFAIKGLSKEEKSLFEGTGKTMRHIKIFSLDEIDEQKIVQLMQLVNKSE